MPIVGINDDGTVTIARKSGRDRITVKPEDLPKYNPTLVKDYNDYLEQSKKLKETTTAQTPVSNTQDILNRTQNLSTASERTGAQDAVLFSEEVKKALGRLDEAEKGGLPGASGPITNFLAGVSQAIGKDTPEAALRDQLKNIVQLIRKQRTGVAFAPAEQKELEDMFGSLKVQEGPLRRKLEDLLGRSSNEINAKTGISRDEVEKVLGYQGAEVSKKNGGILDFLGLGSSRRVAQDIGTSIGQKQSGAVDAQNAALASADKLDERAANEKDKEKQKRLRELAQQIRTKVTGNTEDLQKGYSEDIDKSYLERGMKTGAEIASAADLGNMLVGSPKVGPFKGSQSLPKSVMNIIKKTPELVKSGGPKSIKDILQYGNKLERQGVELKQSAVDEAMKAGKTADKERIVENLNKEFGGKNFTKTSESQRQEIKKMFKSFKSNFGAGDDISGKNVSPQTLLDRLDASTGAFTKEGGIKDMAAGRFEAAVNRVLKKEFETIAPDVLKGQSKIRNAKLLQNVLNRKRALQSGAVVGTGYVGYRILDKLLRNMGAAMGGGYSGR